MHELMKDRGFLWRLYSYWRFEARDGGVYIHRDEPGPCRAGSYAGGVPQVQRRAD